MAEPREPPHRPREALEAARRSPGQDSYLYLDFGGEADLRSYHSDGLCLT